MTEQVLINAGFTKRIVTKEESGNVSDATIEIDGDNWTVDCFEIDNILITEAGQLFNFLETMKICTRAN